MSTLLLFGVPRLEFTEVSWKFPLDSPKVEQTRFPRPWQSLLYIRLSLLLRKMEDVPERHDFPAAEEAVAALWDKIDAFQTTLKRSEGKPRYSFYDGPPFATGLPHYGHILAGTIKDTVTRYASQNGFYVERRFVPNFVSSPSLFLPHVSLLFWF